MRYFEGNVILNKNETISGIFPRIWRDQVFKRNENVVICIIGKLGSGKSYTGLSIGNELGLKPENIVFTIKDFLGRVNSGELKAGDVLLYDEAEVDLDNLSFWDKMSRSFSHVMATIRSRNYIIIFTMPFKNDIITKVRRLIHWNIMCSNIKNVRQGYTLVRITMNNPNHQTGEMWDRYLRIYQNGRRHRLKTLKVFMPPKPLVEFYEAQKAPYVDELYRGIEKEIFTDPSGIKLKADLTDRQAVAYHAFFKFKPKIQKDWARKMQEHFGLSTTDSALSGYKKSIIRKGYSFTDKTPEQLEQIEKRALQALDRLQEEGGLFVKEEKEEKKGDKE